MITAHLSVVSVTDECAFISPPVCPTAVIHLCKLAGRNGVTGSGCFLSFKGRSKGTQQAAMHASGGSASGGRSWYRHTGGAPGELAMISWMLVLSSRRMPDQNLGCTYNLFTDVPTACAQPWANDITLHLGFLVSQGKVNNSCHVLWSSLICVQERHDVSCGICSAHWWHSALCQPKWELQSYSTKHQREWRVWSRSQSRQFQQMLKTEDSGE